MGNWYTSRELVKAAASIIGTDHNAIIDAAIEAASREIDRLTNRRFIPITATRYYDWPHSAGPSPYVLLLDEDLLSASLLTKEGDDATEIVDTDYFLCPANVTPYQWIEIDLASSAFFASKDTHQRQIHVTGSWGYCNDTVTGGTVTSGLAASAAATSFVCSNAALIDVGDTLLIESEQLFVSERAANDVGKNTNGALTASQSETTVTLEASHGVNAGEVILVNAERMYVESVSGNVLAVKRAYDGTTLAVHSDAQDVYVFRTLTVVRGVNGTTAATHANATAISKYRPPALIRKLCKALALADDELSRGGWTGSIGSGEGVKESRMTALNALKDDVRKQYRRRILGAV